MERNTQWQFFVRQLPLIGQRPGGFRYLSWPLLALDLVFESIHHELVFAAIQWLVSHLLTRFWEHLIALQVKCSLLIL